METHELSIMIPASAYKAFEPGVRRAIMAFFLSEFGGASFGSPDAPISEGRDEQGLARLTAADAKLFLNNCSEKTTTILQEIVSRDGDFMSSDIEKLVGSTKAQLRGAWAGLTKRIRTITKNPEATLFNWFKQGDEWHGIMAAQTVASMRVALDERA